MATVDFNKRQFEKEIGKLTDEMREKTAMLGLPVDAEDNEKITLEVFPNRPDLLSFQGFKRAFLAYTGKSSGLKSYKVNKPEKGYSVSIDSSVKNVRPFTACAVVKGLELDNEKIKEIIDIQEKLHLTLGRKRKKIAIGIYPLEKIKFPLTFLAIEPDKIKFIPLGHEKEISGLEILQKHPAGKEYAHLLAGKAKFPIFTDADGKILSMPPVINSHLTGRVDEKTKDVFVECSGFDFYALCKCLNIIVTCLADMGGKIFQVEIKGAKKAVTPDLNPETMKISLASVNKLLGLELKEKNIGELLEKMGFGYKKNIVSIPAWRTDILHEVDLAEDVAIAYGYENFIPEIPSISTIGKESRRETLKRKIAQVLSGMGILEVSNYHLTTKNDQFSKMGVPEKQEKGFVEVESSKTEYSIMRKNLSHYLMKNLSENVDSEYPQKIFELGKVFGSMEKSEEVSEEESLAIAITPGNFTELKQAVEYIFRMIGINAKISEPNSSIPGHFIEGRTAEIKINDSVIGLIGEIHPKILHSWKIKMPVALMEISMEKIFDMLN